MWIRSQSLLTLANFKCLKIRQYGSKEFAIVGEGDIILGKYSTQDKALKVLDEIQKRTEYLYHKAFQMPQDEDVEV